MMMKAGDKMRISMVKKKKRRRVGKPLRLKFIREEKQNVGRDGRDTGGEIREGGGSSLWGGRQSPGPELVGPQRENSKGRAPERDFAGTC